MKPITQLLNRHVKTFQSNCQSFKSGICEREGGCACYKRAEIWSYIDSVVPDEYRHFTIQHFDGKMKDGNTILPEKSVANAREALVKYCWENIEEGEDYDETWIPRCILPRRRDQGSSLLIYGNPWQNTSNNGFVKTFKKPLGKTMLATIVMKEVIFQRFLPHRSIDRYAWVNYDLLCKRLIDKAEGSPEAADDVALYHDADWLVIDGIYRLTNNEGGRAYRASVLNNLLSERVEEGLPNILVFQDDLSKFDDFQHDFGSAMASIINSRKTHRVGLSL